MSAPALRFSHRFAPFSVLLICALLCMQCAVPEAGWTLRADAYTAASVAAAPVGALWCKSERVLFVPPAVKQHPRKGAMFSLLLTLLALTFSALPNPPARVPADPAPALTRIRGMLPFSLAPPAFSL